MSNPFYQQGNLGFLFQLRKDPVAYRAYLKKQTEERKSRLVQRQISETYKSCEDLLSYHKSLFQGNDRKCLFRTLSGIGCLKGDRLADDLIYSKLNLQVCQCHYQQMKKTSLDFLEQLAAKTGKTINELKLIECDIKTKKREVTNQKISESLKKHHAQEKERIQLGEKRRLEASEPIKKRRRFIIESDDESD